MITKKAAEKEAKRRQAILDAKPKPIIADRNFPQQQAFIEDPARYIDAQCSRRAGKTNGLAIRFFNTLAKYPKSRCVYLGLTFESAKDIMIPVLREINDKYNIGCTFLDSSNSALMKHPNGAQLKILGADMKNFIKRLKGRKHPAIGIDEAQDFGTHLQSLIDDVLVPCIADYEDGWLALTGTPGPVPQGYFYEVTKNHKYGYSHHEWTIMDNPYMPNPEAFLSDLKAKREWDNENPTLRREWLNKWVLDQKALWIQYSEKLNDYKVLPKEHKWNHVMGVDIGFNDADALAILAWSETSKETYLVEEVVTTKQGLSALTAQIDEYQKKYDVTKIVLDEGGLGKKIAEDLRKRFGCPLEPADKANKQSNVEFLNDDLRRGIFRARSTSRFALDSYLVQIDWEKSTPNKIIIKKKPHSDIIDAVLYAFRESYAYTHKPEAPRLVPGTDEYQKKMAEEMFEREREGMMADALQEKIDFGEW